MKNFKQKILITIILLAVLVPGLALSSARNSTIMVQERGLEKLQVFAPREIFTVSGAGDVDVSNYTVVRFDANLTIYFNSASTATWEYVAGDPIGIIPGVITTIHVNAACGGMGM